METYKIIVLSIGIPLLFIDFYFMFKYLESDMKILKNFKRNKRSELPNLNKQYKKAKKQNKKENSWTFE